MTRNAPPEQQAVDINEVIADVLSFAHGELLAKGVSVRKALFESLPWLLEIAQIGLVAAPSKARVRVSRSVIQPPSVLAMASADLIVGANPIYNRLFTRTQTQR